MNIDRFVISDSKTLVWTLTSHGYQFLTHNLYKLIQKCGIKWKLCVICADDASYQYMRREGISAIKSEVQLPDFGLDISPFGSGNFQRLNLLKLRILDSLAKDNRLDNCIYMDGDIAVYKDFVPDILERLKLDGLLFQCDEQKRDILCGGNKCGNCCTGFIAWSHGSDGEIFAMNDRSEWLTKPEDQVWVNKKLVANSVKYKTLDRHLYPNGTFVSQEGIRNDAYILHYNYRVGKVKVADMKRFGDWLLVV
jgi:hypothetical protein